MFGFAGVLAHQGGWDEMLLIALPIGLFVLLLRIANSRAAAAGGADVEPEPVEPEPVEPEPVPADEPVADDEPDR